MDPFRANDHTPVSTDPNISEQPASLMETPDFLRWWATLTGPQDGAFGPSIGGQERLRRARLVSAMLILGFISILLLIPGAISRFALWMPVFILAGSCLLITLLNKFGRINLSAFCLVAMVDTAVAGFLILKPQLTAGNISDLDLFILAVLIGGMVLPRGLIALTGLVQITLIVVLFLNRPHDVTLTQLIQADGYSTLAGPLVLQVVGTGIAWLSAWSVQRALIRANRAEELANARAELTRQANLTEARNQRLEQGIAQILETHRQVAAGNLEARAPTQKDHELWQIAHSLNNLLMRLQQYVRERQRTAFQQGRDRPSSPGSAGYI